MPPHVVIVGGGFAGLDAARALNGHAVRVTLLDRHNHHVFQPLLYQVATAGLSPGDIASPIRWILRKQANIRVLLGEVLDLVTSERTLRLDGPPSLAHEPARASARLVEAAEGREGGGEWISYDYLVLAPGATHSYFGHPEWASEAPGLKTLDDALAIRRRMLLAFEQAEREPAPGRKRHLLTFAIIGGGPTGVELAGALAEIARHTLVREFDTIDPESARIVLLEGGPTILPAFPEPLRDSARRALRRLGIEVLENAPVTDVTREALTVGGESLAAHTILWAAGVAASPLGRALDVELDPAGRVIVLPDLSVPGRPEIFIAGDLACFTHQTGKPLPGVAQVAKQQGRHAARGVLRRIDGTATVPFHYRDPGNMATIGRASAIADFGWARASGYLGWLLWLFVHIMFLTGFRNRLSVLLQWSAAYATHQRSVRLITGAGTNQADP